MEKRFAPIKLVLQQLMNELEDFDILFVKTVFRLVLNYSMNKLRVDHDFMKQNL